MSLLHLIYLALYTTAFCLPCWRVTASGQFGLWTCTDTDDVCSRARSDILPVAVLQCACLVLAILAPVVAVLGGSIYAEVRLPRCVSVSFPVILALTCAVHVTSLMVFAVTSSDYGEFLVSFKISVAASVVCLLSMLINFRLCLSCQHPLVELGESLRLGAGRRRGMTANYHNGEATRLLPSDQGSRLVLLVE